jgi:hypothetical protein
MNDSTVEIRRLSMEMNIPDLRMLFATKANAFVESAK